MSMPIKPDSPGGKRKRISAGGGVIIRLQGGRREVLLILRRGLWDLPKGKIEANESPEEGALREVEEETGCGGLSITGPLGTTMHDYEEHGEQVTKKTWWYAMESGRPDLKPQLEEEIEALEWTDLAGASEKVAFENLRDVLHRLQELLK
ncbi:MAG: NUDIX hydrolase [Balneolaceae bacterium]|nr:MAG: NUDIX hydrolase [Balneolaceae bacterium]